ncbi:MAG: flagellar biosynthetic protein FliR [Clostridiales bacterium]|nr:flagellar biosynthetic protein FliR [Clostridiales bacterium]
MFVRILAFIIILPVLSGANMNNMAKLTFSLLVSLLLVSSGNIAEVSYLNTPLGYALLILQEFFTGFILGFMAFIAFNLVFFAGQLLDFQIGFSMVSVFDPITQVQVPIIGNLYFMIICAMLVQTGGFHKLLAVIFYSYEALPIGKAEILQNPALMNDLLGLMTNFLIVAFQTAMPILGAILIVDVAMGLLVKAVPQMNVFVVGMPIKLLVGLLLLILTAPILSETYNAVFEMAYSAVIAALKGLAQSG